MQYRQYNTERDFEAIKQIWKEIGWAKSELGDKIEFFFSENRTIVADLNDSPESIVVSFLGQMRYLEEELDFSAIAAVTTSLVARKQNLAANLTAAKIALDARDGAEICGLGMFEQGFYNQLGFGTGPYEHKLFISPSSINVDLVPNPPIRLKENDYEIVHKSMINRKRGHGALNLPISSTRLELLVEDDTMGFGYLDESKDLTHHVMLFGTSTENGPYRVMWTCFREKQQFLELMALIKSFGDQVHLISMLEPPNVNMQDLLIKPFAHQIMTSKSEFENQNRANAFWQIRILDLEKCLSKTHIPVPGIKFNLEVHDPISKYLEDNRWKWKGVNGQFIVSVGEESSVIKGYQQNLPVLKCSIGAFTRLWMGILPASTLYMTDDLSGDESLIRNLDFVFRLPIPRVDWVL